jgi:acyl-CoA thioester hydrolase
VSEEPYSAVYEQAMTVPASVIDGNGHVNNVAYVQWMQDVAILHFEALGGAGMMAEHGAVWVARSHQIEYLRPVFQADELVMRTWISGMERVKSVRHYEFVKEGVVIAQGETDWIFVDAQSGRPKRIPEEMKATVRN